MPFQRRLPKRRFPQSVPRRLPGESIVDDLVKIEGTEIDLATLHQSGLLRRKNYPVKILGNGELTKALTVKAHAFSASAKEKIEKAGGTVEILSRASVPGPKE